MSKGLGQVEGFAWTWGTTERLPEYVGPSSVLPMREMDAYPVHQHPGPRMHRFVARTKVMVILLLTYMHV